MKKSIFLFICILSVHLAIGQQNVGVGTSTPDASAKLEVSSTTQGMLVPRMTTAQRIAISSPASGLLVFDMTTNSFWFRGGSSWVQLVDSVHTELHRSGATMVHTGITDNVGIGTTTPAYKLQVKTGDNQYGISHTNGTVDLVTHVSNSTGGRIGTKSNHPFQLYANDGMNQLILTPSGNVGIGTPAPHAPLQFASVEASRKIVLFENGNNDNQFFGFGINASVLRYQAQGDHVFYFGVNATTSNELMRITSGGRVGIGATDPVAMLEIARGTAPFGNLLVYGTTFMSMFNFGAPEDTYIRGGKAGARVLINDLTGQGNVGIGTPIPLQKLHVGGNLAVDNYVGIENSAPNAPLQFASVQASRKIVLFENGNNDNQFFGFGINPSALRYQAQGDHVFYFGVNATTSNELMRIKGDGNVGIGTNNPQATLEIKRGTAPNGSLQINGTTYASHFNFGSLEDTYIRGGKSGGKVIINDYGDFGNVGIGTANPLQKLHVGGNVAVDGNVGIGIATPLLNKLDIQLGTRTGSHATGRPLYVTGDIFESSNGVEFRHTNGTQGIGFGYNTIYATGSDASQNLGIQARGTTGNVILSTNGNEQMRISGDGRVGIGLTNPLQKLHVGGIVAVDDKVGIGNTNPHAPLQFANSVASRKIVLWEDVNNDHRYYGFGINSNSLRYQVSQPESDHVFYAAETETSSKELMRIKGTGNVDIPGKLEIGYEVIYSDISTINGFTYGISTCSCPAGSNATGGGYIVDNIIAHVIKNYPYSNYTWYVGVYNADVQPLSLRSYVICARLAN